MNDSNQGRYAFLIVFISFLFVIGSLIAVFAETGYTGAQPPAQTATPQITDIVFFTPTVFTPTMPPAATLTNTLAPSATNPPAPTATEDTQVLSQCDPPDGWVIYFIQAGETIDDIAADYNTTAAVLINGNCLSTTVLQPGLIIFVPVNITSTPAPTTSGCTAPAGWVTYTIKSGDTLYHISKLFQTTVADLQNANCMGTSTTIITGTRLWVPNNATITPTRTATATKTARPTKTLTPSPIPNSAPVAVADGPYSVALGDTLTITAPGVLGNDSDPNGDPLTASIVSGPLCATTFTLNPDGSFEYVAALSCASTSDTFTYLANDGIDDSNIATVTINLP